MIELIVGIAIGIIIAFIIIYPFFRSFDEFIKKEMDKTIWEK